jgi:hypothetical protein
MNTKIRWTGVSAAAAVLLAGFSAHGQNPTEVSTNAAPLLKIDPGQIVGDVNALNAPIIVASSCQFGRAPEDQAVLPVLVPMDKENFVRANAEIEKIHVEGSAHVPVRPVLMELMTTHATTLFVGTNPPAPIIFSSGSNSCVGTYYAYARFTNTSVTPKSIWWRPPTGTTSCTIADASGITDPAYVPVVEAVRRSDLVHWCGTNSVTFPATSTQQYQFGTYIKNQLPPPSAGQTLELSVQWQ